MQKGSAAHIADVQSKILTLLKERGEATMQEISSYLQVSYEAVRQQVKQLEISGLVRQKRRPNPAGVGRPLRYYSLSSTGEHFFPKQYANLAINLVDAVGDTLGTEALRQVLSAVTDSQVAAWEWRLAGLGLRDRLEALREFYLADDPYMEVVSEPQTLQLVERNCPYLNVALERPALCSTTVSTLTRLLGHRVTRVRRFQHGDGRCVFRVHLDQPLESGQHRFEFERE
jgi:predicted ArsR family transcriptional regulator